MVFDQRLHRRVARDRVAQGVRSELGDGARGEDTAGTKPSDEPTAQGARALYFLPRAGHSPQVAVFFQVEAHQFHRAVRSGEAHRLGVDVIEQRDDRRNARGVLDAPASVSPNREETVIEPGLQLVVPSDQPRVRGVIQREDRRTILVVRAIQLALVRKLTQNFETVRGKLLEGGLVRRSWPLEEPGAHR